MTSASRSFAGTDGGLAPPLTEQADDIERVWNVFLYIACGVGLFVAALLVVVIVRYRRRGTALPRQVHYNIPIEVAYVVVPLLVVVGLFVLTFVSVNAIDEMDDDEVDLVVEVTAFQWQWRFAYPDTGVAITGSDTEIPELVLPASTSVRFELTSIDVIHSFWIPGFRYKRDMFPGETSSFQVDVGTTTGSFPNTGVCAEFCGLDHERMRFSVSVVSPEEFERWVAEQLTARAPAGDEQSGDG